MHEAPIPLSVTLQPLGRVTDALDEVSAMGLAGVQFDASDPDLRPREMSESARRDLAAALRRRGLQASGLDCFVPVERFADATRVERAVEAMQGSILLAESLGRVPVCLFMPSGARDVADSLEREAQRRGVTLADFAWPVSDGSGAVGIDPAALLGAGADPASAVRELATRLAAARVVDLLRSGLRGPIGEQGGSRLDAMAYRLALEMAGFSGLPVIDCRQWQSPQQGVRWCASRWVALLPAVGGSAT
ncbi:MAG: sugar phosphate isomerase/epimerase family protein [Phycisphaerales bacterium]